MNRGAIRIHIYKRLLSGDSAAIQAYKQFRKSQLSNVELYPIYSNLWSGNQSINASATPQKRSNSILEGRITGLRFASKKLIFIDIHTDFQTKQAILNAKHIPIEVISEFKSQAQIGDIYQLFGEHGKNEKGAELFVVKGARMLAPCLRKIPSELKDVAIKHRFPHVNMLVDENPVIRYRKRSKLIWKLRQELHEIGFEEVETPCLSPKAGGATAKPFETNLLTNDQNLFLRIAPELYLKRLVIGGYDKVFEIGKQFRNEGIDATHNPEFTTLELYWTYSDLDMMIKFTEGLIRKLIIECNHGNPTVGDINFGQKFGQLDVCTELEKELGNLPDLNDEGSVPMLVKLAEKHQVDLKGLYTLPKIVDKLISNLVESKLHMPTFLTGHPVCLSPLSKSENGRARRFELFIGGREIANSYEELNDPNEQITRFELQGSNEDYDYCEALEYGLPPCTGLGIGIDRLAMLICNTSKIKDVITFPMI